MKLIRVLPMVFLALTLSACCGTSDGDGGSAGSGGGDSALPDGFTKVPNSKEGLLAKVPDNAVPNGFGGAAGFHSEDKSFGFMVREVKDTKTIEEAKKSAEELFFKEWIKSDKTADGWVLTYKTSKIDMKGDEPKEVGVNFSFEVRKKIGDKTFKCYGSVEKEAGLQPSVDACVSLQGS